MPSLQEEKLRIAGEYQPPLNFCIYHKNCSDGFASAWLVAQVYPDCQLIPMDYGEPIKVPLSGNLIIVDFSFPWEVLKTLLQKCDTITLLDHHKTAIKMLEPATQACSSDPILAAKLRIHFDLEQSGAGLTWNYLYSKLDRPYRLLPLVRYVQDGDLFKFQEPHSTLASATILATPYVLEDWNELAKEFWLQKDITNPSWLVRGKAFSAGQEKLMRVAVEEYTTIEQIAGVVVPFCNLPKPWVSHSAKFLWEFYNDDRFIGRVEADPAKRFVAMWYRSFGATQVSLRSRDDGADVSEIAEKFGGGGHRNAARFSVLAPLNVIPSSYRH